MRANAQTRTRFLAREKRLSRFPIHFCIGVCIRDLPSLFGTKDTVFLTLQVESTAQGPVHFCAGVCIRDLSSLFWMNSVFWRLQGREYRTGPSTFLYWSLYPGPVESLLHELGIFETTGSRVPHRAWYIFVLRSLTGPRRVF